MIELVSADQLLAHAVGDYVLQSHWMANEKTKRSVACLAHALTYTLPFALITRSPAALATIASTHFVIDRWRLARFVCWFKNLAGPAAWRKPWSECSATGYGEEVPPWMSVWLMIVTDNVMHVLCNGLAIRFL